MKRFILLFAMFTLMGTTTFAGNDKTITVDQLPTVSKQFIEKYFPKDKVVLAKMDTDLFDKNYDVTFSNGDKIEFDKKGEWKEVDCKFSQVPNEIIPQAILSHIKAHYENVKILKIERDSRSHEVKLSNGLELKFDSKFKLIEID